MNIRDKKIIILGDSSASSLGGCHKTWPELLCSALRVEGNVEILNPSAVGMTMADAWSLLQEVHDDAPLSGAVISVGNCDCCAFGLQKPKTYFWQGKGHVASFNKKYLAQVSLSRRHRPLQYAECDFHQSLRRTVSEEDHAGFLESIVDFCKRKGIYLCLLVPSSNLYYPPALNIGNFFMYALFGARFTGDGIKCANEGFADALRLHSLGDSRGALSRYSAFRGSGEFGWIACNNMASIHCDRAEYEQAEQCLREVPERNNPLYPIILHNTAILRLHAMGEAPEVLLERARDVDKGSYRIQSAYQQAQLRVARARAIDYLEGAPLIGRGEMVDYCHPTQEGHATIAQSLAPLLQKGLALRVGAQTPKLRYVALNPDRYAGYAEDFFVHFGIAAAPNPGFLNILGAVAGGQDYAGVLAELDQYVVDATRRSALSLLGHPLFGMANFLEHSSPCSRVDQGRIAGLFFLRNALPLYQKVEADDAIRSRFHFALAVLPSHASLQAWVPALAVDSWCLDEQQLRRIMQGIDHAELFRRTYTLLMYHLENEPSAHQRLRTITYWFFKESVLFGTASHYSMLFRRQDLLHMLDACLAVLLFDHADAPTREAFQALLDALRSVLEVYRQGLGAFQASDSLRVEGLLEPLRESIAVLRAKLAISLSAYLRKP